MTDFIVCEKAAISSVVVLTEGTSKFRKNTHKDRQAGCSMSGALPVIGPATL